MAQRIVEVPGIGPVLLAKRRGTKNLRLSVSASGRVRVGLPIWVPYAAAAAFVKGRQPWIKRQLELNHLPLLQENDCIGKLHQLRFRFSANSRKPTGRVSATDVTVTTSLVFDDPIVQEVAHKASERALKIQADQLLLKRVVELAAKQGWQYSSIRIRRLSSRWGSYSSDGVITFSYFLVQLPWPLIDYVILHELIHSQHPNHSRHFWADFTRVLPEVRDLQKQIRHYQPRVEPSHLQ